MDVRQDGHFIYTPDANKKGRDYFGYKAVDENGTESQEATVIIQIKRKAPAIRYKDTQGLGCDYAASVLAENDIFTGIQVGGSYYFRPDAEVNENEFIAMCMALQNSNFVDTMAKEYADTLTYPDAAVILNEMLNISPVSCMATECFPDMDEDRMQAISNLVSCGIFPADAVNMAEPLRRSEACTMIYRAATILDARK